MLRIARSDARSNCAGHSRRTALKVGACGLLNLSLADLLRQRAGAGGHSRDKSVILLWLDGGPSQLESYDPKPEAPAEYRGPWTAISTKVPGIHLTEKFPLQAPHTDKMAIVRSLHHDNGDHFAAAHWMLTGKYGSNSANKESMYPSIGSYVSRIRGPVTNGLPTFVGLPAAESVYLYPGYQGAAYLGPAYNPFDVQPQQRYLSATYSAPIKPPTLLTSINEGSIIRTSERVSLLSRLDGVRREIDRSGMMESMDQFQQQAVEMVLSGAAREALDIEQEDDATRDRYGRGPWGHYTLMARRLVEAGVGFVTVDMPHWDNHSRIEKGHGDKIPKVDQAVSALLTDLTDRGLLDDVIVLVMGEFGRTPRLNNGQPGIPIPGRDHWGNAISAMIAGGGIRGGQVVGATNDKAEHPIERPLKPGNLLATVYHLLGIDPATMFPNHAGRPIAILDEREIIRELV
ncbi:MAG: DUF1501 domain-containing protein [Maioricimonas sp. JB049]